MMSMSFCLSVPLFVRFFVGLFVCRLKRMLLRARFLLQVTGAYRVGR